MAVNDRVHTSCRRAGRQTGGFAGVEPSQARIVELRFFGGLTVEETAEAMDISPRTVKREWQMGRSRLDRELAAGEPIDP